MLLKKFHTENQFIDLINDMNQKKVLCESTEHASGGDIRWWWVSEQKYDFSLLIKESEELFKLNSIKIPLYRCIMVNILSSDKLNNGSGDGWHYDRLKTQYKTFSYLSDVDSKDNGALQVFFGSNLRNTFVRCFVKLSCLVSRVVFRNNRLRDSFIRLFLFISDGEISITGKKGTSFIVDTSYPHRGHPVNEGERMAITIYYYNEPEPTLENKKNNEKK